MSDYLNNLVARSLGPAPDLLRPQLPSLFEEPGGSAPILEGEGSINMRAEDAEADRVSPISINRTRLSGDKTDEAGRDPLPPEERRRALPDSNLPARQTIRPDEPEEQMYKPAPPRQETRVAAEPAVSVGEGFGERNQAAGPRVEATARSLGEIEETRPGQNAEPRLVPVIPKMEPPRQAPRLEDDTAAETFPLGDHSPTVRISIGRIDVRAAAQPIPPARTVLANRPKLTLDEYLLRRNGGRG